MPTRQTRLGCSARAPSVDAATPPPISAMNSRRLIVSDPVEDHWQSITDFSNAVLTVHHNEVGRSWPGWVQKCPKRLRLPADKSTSEHTGRIVPGAVIDCPYSITSLARARSAAGQEKPTADNGVAPLLCEVSHVPPSVDDDRIVARSGHLHVLELDGAMNEAPRCSCWPIAYSGVPCGREGAWQAKPRGIRSAVTSSGHQRDRR